ncbi:hypothetical protein M436DRAFT_74564 [Aureobasidium namibiae CBS 147.97]|uniref:DUF4470 domain-containing protein n=1 Tax=Aureobasidium namibiae CBS 147.97 TaxID=1043004 RepID=A0A074XA55_9PEZI|nr:uncharacterized protein M436DRAFT_74564 [Aureobasidium namibiae CBS 147.97]KEQ71506.1 hypothetical protein M436DRAFT_74564 [Aureobasidium namibiae CBS 147.97]
MVKEGERKTKQSTYHFTIIDTKPQVIARAMLVFLLLEELTDKRSLNQEKAEEILATLFYTFMNHIMPPQAYKKLQMTITKAIRLLAQPTTTLSWFDVLQKDRGAVIKALTLWQHKTSQMFSTNTFRLKIAIDTANQSMSPWTPEPGDMPPPAKGLAKDKILYDRAGITLPPPSFSNQDPIKARELVADKSFPKNITASWLSKLDSTWMPNVTPIDVDQVNQQAKAGIPTELMDIDLATDLFAQWADYIQTPHPRNSKCLYDYAEGYFLVLASALTHLRGRPRVEPILGEMCETFEKMRLVPGQTGDSPGKPAEDYPTVYNRVHLSNVTDYTGCSLSALLFAAPITRTSIDGHDTFAFKCLRNPPAFDKVDDYNSEYNLLPDDSSTQKVFPCKFQRKARLPVYPPGMAMIAEDYMHWSNLGTKIEFDKLMDRPSLTTWIHALLLKAAIPAERMVPDTLLVMSPFNLTVMFRVLLHLKGVGYPIHWLSEILTNIITSPLETRATHVSSVPVTVADAKRMLDKSRPLQKISLKPFMADLTTLTSIWQPALGFGLFKGHELLPKPKDIKKYSIDFEYVRFENAFEKTFVLVFMDANLLGHRDVRDSIPLLVELRERGLHVVTTWDFDTEAKQATFWMRHAGWYVGIWRTDSWNVAAHPVPLVVKDLGSSWCA